MLPELYRTHLSKYLSQAQLVTIEILVWLLQVHKEVKIERLAAHFPLPIKYESRRRHLQRLFKLPALSVKLIWLPIIQGIIAQKYGDSQRIYIVLDRTQWQDKNLFVVGIVIGKRALPIYWQFLEKRGASNYQEQKALLKPVFKRLKKYEIVVLGDREFHSVILAQWLRKKKVYFVLRQKKDTNIKMPRQDYQQLSALISPGERRFFQKIPVTKAWGYSEVSMGIYWKRKYRGMGGKEPWYLLTNLPSLEEAVKSYKKRMGIEAMFKDCKTGGYNLEGSKASFERLTRLVLLLAIAYTLATSIGQAIRLKGQEQYIGRCRKVKQTITKNSNFWIGLYGTNWVISHEFLKEAVEELMRLTPNKLLFYLRGQRAMTLIQQAF
ncbi:IS4 family transposase [Lusitaniella coriacea LEGE 07157]|uniref:IS4 family transposase n=1 Tax=Lusitaniella coriacea LEGE 07157 TaxID=945747 RepID=A0A8J7JA97_9CYAN|nr:IS4 family transposase [Lusitaniella coriacea]MBE9116130.1 IS4 family transposase [Lusitaniella coriacea LEGE 07157]